MSQQSSQNSRRQDQVKPRQGQQPGARTPSPFAKPSRPGAEVMAGAVNIEQERAVAEVQASLTMALKFPRNEEAAFDRIMRACENPDVAEGSTFAFQKGEETAKGASIRLAEELARLWGNIEFGTRELSRGDGYSEMEAFAWEKESNTRSSQRFTIRHWRDTKAGGYALKNERDIYELTANLSARRLRARLLSVMPRHVVKAALRVCAETLFRVENETPEAERVAKMVRQFGKLKITEADLAARLGKPLDKITPEQIVEFREVYASIMEGMSKPWDWFKTIQQPAPDAGAAALNQQLTGESTDKTGKAGDDSELFGSGHAED